MTTEYHKIIHLSRIVYSRIPYKDETIRENPKVIRKSAYPGLSLVDSKYKRRGIAFSHADELLDASEFSRYDFDHQHKHGEFAKNGWETRDSFMQIGESNAEREAPVYQVTMKIALGNDNVLYDITKIKEVASFTRNIENINAQNKTAEPLNKITLPQNNVPVKDSIFSRMQNDTGKD